MTLTRRLACFAAALTYDELPEEIVLLTKRLVLDALGTALAATVLGPGCRELVAVTTALGGPAESTILGTGRRVAAPNAAFANGALVHALNYDAVGKHTGHTGVVCLAAPLALAEARAPVTGRDFLTACVAASEVTARLIGAAGEQRISPALLSGQYFSYFGAAAGAGRILGLSEERMQSAFGLALMQVAGSRQVVIGGDPPAKAVYGAFPNQAGVLAALLAEAGLEAGVDALEGDAGFFRLATGGPFDADALTDDLGTRYAFAGVEFKPWPTSNHVTPFIEAALELASGHDLRPAGVARVEVIGPTRIRAWFEPVPERRRPSNAAAAANSVPFAVAKALAHRDVTLGDFTESGLADEPALALAQRIEHRLDDRVEGGVVIVETASGARLEAKVSAPLGSPSRPLPGARLEAKFRDCCSYASLRAEDADALSRFVARLEDAADVAPLLGQMHMVVP